MFLVRTVDNPLKTPGCRAGAGLLHARAQGGALYSSVAVVFCNFEIELMYSTIFRGGAYEHAEGTC